MSSMTGSGEIVKAEKADDSIFRKINTNIKMDRREEKENEKLIKALKEKAKSFAR